LNPIACRRFPGRFAAVLRPDLGHFPVLVRSPVRSETFVTGSVVFLPWPFLRCSSDPVFRFPIFDFVAAVVDPVETERNHPSFAVPAVQEEM